MNFERPFLIWTALGLIGVLLLALSFDLAAIRAAPYVPDLPDIALRGLVVAQPAFLMAIGAAIGVALSENAGLWSWLTRRLRGQEARFPAPVPLLGAGLLAGVAVALVDFFLFGGLTGGAATNLSVPPLGAMLSALTYGGITEELLLRYGLMTLLFWAAWKLTGSHPRAPLAWALIAVVALLFGAGHLPAMAAITDLTPLIILRTIGLNAALGLLYGWLYWRKGLEAAMLAHLATHPGMWLGITLITL